MDQAHDCAWNLAHERDASGSCLPELEQRWDAGSLRRISALAADATAATNFDLSTFWFDACAGRLRITDVFFSPERCYALVRRSLPGSAPSPLSQSRLRILEGLLLGRRAKVVAIDLEMSRSTVAAALRYCLRNLGFTGRSKRVPLLLVMAARAARTGTPFEARISQISLENEVLEVVSAARPDRKLADRLSEAELAVTKRLIEGHAHEEIARARGTSRRTVANQLAAAFRKLGVSGRAELIDQVTAP